MIICFDAEVIRKFKKHAPEFKAFWLLNFSISMGGRLRPKPEVVLKTLQEISADGLSSYAHEMVDESYTKVILQAGFEYHAWTIDDVKTARRFVRLGAMSVTTNKPGVLKAAFNRDQEPAGAG